MYIVEKEDGYFLTNRKPTGILYENRVSWSKDLKDAKIFNTKSAASNSANRTNENFIIKKVKIIIEE